HSDPAFAISNWHHLLSPYGPLFTLFTFALVPLGVATSFWVFKAALMGASLTSLWLVWRCAELLHRDPLKATVLVGLNPLVLVWDLGADHNDVFMMLFVMVAVHLLLRSRTTGFTSGLVVREDLAGRDRRGVDGRGGPGFAGRRAGRVPARGAAVVGRVVASAGGQLAAGRLAMSRAWPVEPAPPVAAGARAAGPASEGLGLQDPGSHASVSDAPVSGRPGNRAGVAWSPGRRVDRVDGGLAVGREQALEFGCGLALVCALAIKLPAAVLLPIVFVVSAHRRWLVAGMAVAGVGVAAAGYVAFGTHLPDLGTQSDLVTAVGLPNLFGYGLGLGGETVGLRIVLTGGLLVVIGLCTAWARRRTGDWIAPAGVAILVLLATLSWQAPWYMLWLLPFAALTRRPHLRVAALVFGVYLIVAFVPAINVRPPGTPLEQAHARDTDHLAH
ncbi:MAG TPA: hypothetical protein VHW26_06260, partial [Solirubrobacteraceae bacterium]|nr:hypothetical protein [Solirubrobacteraceae bacterium]